MAQEWMEHFFLLYDSTYKQEESDPSEDAIITFIAPTEVNLQTQIHLSGNLVGSVSFSQQIGTERATCIHFRQCKLAFFSFDTYFVALSGSLSEEDYSLHAQLDQVLDCFSFYHGSFSAIKADLNGDRNKFSTRMTRILTRIFAHVRPPRDIVRASFPAIPVFRPLPEKNRCFIQCAQLIRHVEEQPAVLAVGLLYQQRVVCSTLSVDVEDHVLTLVRPSYATSFIEQERRRLTKKAAHLRKIMQKKTCIAAIQTRHELRTNTAIPNCFLGSHFVDLLHHLGEASTREEGVRLGNQLLSAGKILHVTNRFEFQDSTQLYWFKEDARSAKQQNTKVTRVSKAEPSQLMQTVLEEPEPATPLPLAPPSAPHLGSPLVGKLGEMSSPMTPPGARIRNMRRNSSTSSLVPAVSPSPSVSAPSPASPMKDSSSGYVHIPVDDFESRMSIGRCHKRIEEDCHLLGCYLPVERVEELEARRGFQHHVEAKQRRPAQDTHRKRYDVTRNQFSSFSSTPSRSIAPIALASKQDAAPVFGDADTSAARSVILESKGEDSSASEGDDSVMAGPPTPRAPSKSRMSPFGDDVQTPSPTLKVANRRSYRRSRLSQAVSTDERGGVADGSEDLQAYLQAFCAEHVTLRKDRAPVSLLLQRHHDTLLVVLVDPADPSCASTLSVLPEVVKHHLRRCQDTLHDADHFKHVRDDSNFSYLTFDHEENDIEARISSERIRSDARYFPESKKSMGFVQSVSASRSSLMEEDTAEVVLRRGKSVLFGSKVFSQETYFQSQAPNPRPFDDEIASLPSKSAASLKALRK